MVIKEISPEIDFCFKPKSLVMPKNHHLRRGKYKVVVLRIIDGFIEDGS
jgi:hypothetical protein